MNLRIAALAALYAAFAFGQAELTDKVVPVANPNFARDAASLATIVRSVVQLPEATPDLQARTLKLRGTTSQIALAEWLVTELDKPEPSGSRNPEYRAPANGNDVTRIFRTAHAVSPREIQELSTVVRSIFEIRQLFVFPERGAVIARGTSDQIAGAEWLIRKLDRPISTIGDKEGDKEVFQQFSSTDPDNTVRVFHLASSNEASHQEAVTSIRTAAKARRGFMYMPTRVFVIRGTAEQLATAESMVAGLDNSRSPAR